MRDLRPALEMQEETTSSIDVKKGVGSGSGLFSQMDLERSQRRLQCLYHAASCKIAKDCRCPKMLHCHSMKRLYTHIGECKGRTCSVPGCVKSKIVWKHFLKCTDDKCSLCSIVPQRPSSPRSGSGRPPLSPRREPLNLLLCQPIGPPPPPPPLCD